MNNLVCIIPAKGGSKRVPKKNLQEVGDLPLVIDAALRADEIDEFASVYIDTDSVEIAELAARYGFSVLARPSTLSDDFNEVIKWHLTDTPAADADGVCHVHCTAPLLTVETLQNMTREFVRIRGSDSLFTAIQRARFDWQGNWPDITPNYSTRDLPRSQEIEKVWEETHGAYLFTKKHFLATGSRYSRNPRPFPVTELEAYDIDTQQDLRIVQVLRDAIRRGDL